MCNTPTYGQWLLNGFDIIRKFDHMNWRLKNRLLPFKLRFHHCQSPCEPGDNICNTFSTGGLHEGIFLIQGPYLSILQCKENMNINVISTHNLMLTANNAQYPSNQIWDGICLTSYNYPSWYLTLSWDFNSNKEPKNLSRRSGTACQRKKQYSNKMRKYETKTSHHSYLKKAMLTNDTIKPKCLNDWWRVEE